MYAVPLKLRNICITCRYIENIVWDRIILDKFQNDVDWRMTQISNVSPSKYDWGFHYNQNGSNNPLNGLCKNLNSFVSADSTISRQSLVQYNLTLVCVIIVQHLIIFINHQKIPGENIKYFLSTWLKYNSRIQNPWKL